ncbi:MAG: MBL fold metallo-hydrolase [Proteobacteria bacterium]|nr:MBL fold metallo-hydrolase [Pseudomonadota bacterium]
MTIFLCPACGASYDGVAAPDRCPICEDERQYVPAAGQRWTTPAELAADHRNAWQWHEPGLLSLQTVPAFAINQRAFLLITPGGNILWDCLALLDEATEALVRGLGGLAGIAISHPHFYARMQDWAAAFDAPIHLHAADRAWITRSSPAIRFWEGDRQEIAAGLTLLRLGGHFPGSTVLHWPATADGAGALLAGDTVQITPGARRVTFMYSYPNYLPLPAATVRRMAATLAPWRYERIYGAFAGQDVMRGGAAMVAASAAAYIRCLEAPPVAPPVS